MDNLALKIAPLLRFTWLTLLLLSGSRILLSLWQHEHLEGTEQFLLILVLGLRTDLMLVSMILVLPVLALACVPSRWTSAVIACSTVWCATWFIALVFLEAVTPAYMTFFEARPGRILFEYLNRPTEVAGLIAGGYKLHALFAVSVTVAAAFVTRFWLAGARRT